MAELTQQERLQPSLLDRLTDDDPRSNVESRDKRVLSFARLRECVLRDLAWLMNTERLADVTDLTEHPEVKTSVLNYGIPSLSGVALTSVDVTSLERQIRQAIWDFEPRILRDTVAVRAHLSNEMNNRALWFEIEGELWAQPIPLRLFLRTEVDLETGNVTVTDRGRL